VGCRTLVERGPALGGGHCSHRVTTTVPTSTPNAARTPNPTPSSAGVASSGHAGDHAAADRLQSAAGVGLSAALGNHHPQFARGYTPVSKATSRIILVDNSITPPLFYWAFQGRILSPLIFDDRVTCGDCTTRYWHESIGGRSTGQIDATQTELGSELDVCAATISNRLNSIDGFDWQDRRAFARGVFGDGQSVPAPRLTPSPSQDPDRPPLASRAPEVARPPLARNRPAPRRPPKRRSRHGPSSGGRRRLGTRPAPKFRLPPSYRHTSRAASRRMRPPPGSSGGASRRSKTGSTPTAPSLRPRSRTLSSCTKSSTPACEPRRSARRRNS